MRIFITGGTGFIGGNVVKQLAGKGHHLRCLVRETSETGPLEDAGVELMVGDVRDKNSLLIGMEGCDWVINLANVYSFWEPDRSIFQAVNVTGTRNVMEAALEKGVSKVVHISTGGIFGRPEELPFTEDSPVGPERFCEYFETKYQGDMIAWDLFESRNLPLVIVYPMAVLGAGDPKATGQYIRRLIEKKMPARVYEDKVFTFVHVKDVADIIIRAAERENNIGEKYIAGKLRYTFGEINRMVAEISGVPLPKMRMPNFMVMFNARLLTLLADLIKKPPLWGMATGQMRIMKAEFIADGVKVEKELGVSYRTIHQAIEETIASFR
jgi:dihydroflavonol-4-reductase